MVQGEREDCSRKLFCEARPLGSFILLHMQLPLALIPSQQLGTGRCKYEMTITLITSARISLVKLWSHGPHAAATKVGKCSSTGQPYAQQEENKLVVSGRQESLTQGG